MTKWQEFPLRPQGQPWPGLNTRGGLLDPGTGQLEDGSFNQIINESDLLEKRHGFVRGLNERFDGVVCGLFKYTDECGREYVLVADQGGIKIRQPFDIPTFVGADSFPGDDFEDGLSAERWRNLGDYEVVSGSLRLKSTAATSPNQTSPSSRHLVWFKEAAAPSYFVEVNYAFDTAQADTTQIVSVVIKKAATTFLIADVIFSSTTYQVVVRLVQGSNVDNLIVQDLTGSPQAAGLLRLTFNAGTRGTLLLVTPTGGSLFSEEIFLNELQANSLGQDSALGLAFNGTTPPAMRINEVVGGTI